MPLIAESFVGHGFPAFSKLRRSRWRQRKPEPKRSAYWQTSGVFRQAIRGIERLPQIPGPASFRIGKTPLIAESFVGHGSSLGTPATYPHSLINLMVSQSIFFAGKLPVAIPAIRLTLLQSVERGVLSDVLGEVR
jgi:hypothetical protein